MIIEDIDKYIKFGSNPQICIYRNKLDGLDIIIMSLYIVFSENNNYALQMVFDPVGMIDQGEGWIWQTSSMPLSTVISVVENFSGELIEEWENFTKTGRFESLVIEIERSEARKQNQIFIDRFKGGEVFLPKLPQGIYWEITP